MIVGYALCSVLVASLSVDARADEPAPEATVARRPPPTAPPIVADQGHPSEVPTWEAVTRPPSESGPEAGARIGLALPMGSGIGDAKFDPGPGMIPFWADAGFRLNRTLFIGLYGQIGYVIPSSSNCGDGFSCRTLSFRTGPTVQVHTMPDSKADLWFGVGAGYEWLKTSVSSDAGSDSITAHGFEFLNLTAGLLFNIVDHDGLGPFVGMTMGKYSSLSGLDISDSGMHRWLMFGIHGSTMNPL
jgi:hypothetical protein